MIYLMATHVQQHLSLAILVLRKDKFYIKKNFAPVFSQKLRVPIIHTCTLYSNKYGKSSLTTGNSSLECYRSSCFVTFDFFFTHFPEVHVRC